MHLTFKFCTKIQITRCTNTLELCHNLSLVKWIKCQDVQVMWFSLLTQQLRVEYLWTLMVLRCCEWLCWPPDLSSCTTVRLWIFKKQNLKVRLPLIVHKQHCACSKQFSPVWFRERVQKSSGITGGARKWFVLFLQNMATSHRYVLDYLHELKYLFLGAALLQEEAVRVRALQDASRVQQLTHTVLDEPCVWRSAFTLTRWES